MKNVRMDSLIVKPIVRPQTPKQGKGVMPDWKVVVVSSLLVLLTGCSMKVEFGYHGQTGRDDQTVTKDFKTPQKSSRY